jgi:glycosyltransferase involved in cell wall biosynthesis
MTKLVIQIPCYNEEHSLPITLASLRRELPGVDELELLIIDDGSTDATAAVARAHGVEHVVILPRHQGLAKAFLAGLEASLRAGADIIVNTDADNQYCADDIPKLIAPILAGQAELVVGARPILAVEHFTWTKKCLQRIGSWVTRKISNTEVQDAPSGFRAISRQAASRLHVFNDYTYTIETIIQAGLKGMAVASVPVRTNAHLRPSRLIRGLWSYLSRQVLTMVRVFMTYRPFPFFAVPGAIMLGIGILISLRFLYFYFMVGGQGHVQSLILAALLLGLGFFLVVIGLIADLIAVNRALLEGIDWRVKRLEELGLSEGQQNRAWASGYGAPEHREPGDLRGARRD